MKTRYLKVQGDVATPLPDRLQAESTHSLELTNAKYDAYTSPFYFKVVNGEPVEKTQAEIDADQLAKDKIQAQKDAWQTYRSIVTDVICEANGEKYVFDSLSLTLYLAQYTHTNGTGFKWKPKDKSQRHLTRPEAEALYASLTTVINDAFDAYDADRTEILDNDNLSLSNLATVKASQDALK